MWKWMMVLCMVCTAALSAEINVLALSGSTREDSVNKKLVAEAAKIARQKGAKVTVIDLKDYEIPFYNGDLETKEGMPAKAKQLRRQMVESQVILIASPEYNGSLSAVLKNVIDWASRSEEGTPSREAFQGKKFILMSASPGPGGGARGLAHLRSILENVGATVVSGQITVPNAFDAFDSQGQLKSPQLKVELQQVVESSLLLK